jgi:hypothetical protein
MTAYTARAMLTAATLIVIGIAIAAPLPIEQRVPAVVASFSILLLLARIWRRDER